MDTEGTDTYDQDSFKLENFDWDRGTLGRRQNRTKMDTCDRNYLLKWTKSDKMCSYDRKICRMDTCDRDTFCKDTYNMGTCYMITFDMDTCIVNTFTWKLTPFEKIKK